MLACFCYSATHAGAPAYYRLANGLEVFLSEDHSSSVAAIIALIRTGSINETEEMNGATHLLEHLLFDGTKTRTQQELQQEVDDMGGYFNAFTRKDYTLFMIVSPSDSIRQAVDIQRDMLFHSIIPEEQLEKEKKVVLEEIVSTRGRESFKVQELFDSLFLAGTPYSMSVLGLESAVKNITRDRIYDYYRNHYVPQSMTLIAIGDFDIDDMTTLINETYGREQNAEKVEKETSSVKYKYSPGKKTAIETHQSVQEAYLFFGFPAPGPGTDDAAAYDYATQWVSGGEASLLQASLKDQDIEVYSLSGWTNHHKNLSCHQITVKLKPELIDSVKKTIEECLRSISNFTPDHQAMKKIGSRLRSDMLLAGERFDHRAWSYASFAATGNILKRDALLNEYLNVEPEEVIAIAAKYFNPHGMFVLSVLPAAEKDPADTPAVESFGRCFTPVKEENVKKSVWNVDVSHLKNGLTILTETGRDVPVAAASFIIKGRSALEPGDLPGIADLTAKALLSGTQTYDKQELDAQLDLIGARLQVTDNPFLPFDDYYYSRDYLTIRLELPAENLDDGLSLLRNIIRSPLFPENELETLKQKHISHLRMRNRNASKTAEIELMKSLYPESSYGKPVAGTVESVNSIDQTDVKAFYSEYFTPKDAFISVSAPWDRKHIIRKLEKDWNDWNAVSDRSPTKMPVAHSRSVKERINLPGKQVSLVWGRRFHAPAEEFHVYRLIATLLSNKLIETIREKEGLAYSLGASVKLNPDDALFVIKVNTSQGNEKRTVDLVNRIVEDFTRLPLDEKETARAVREITGRKQRYMQRSINRTHFAVMNLMNGLEPNRLEDFKGITDEESLKKIAEAAAKILDWKNSPESLPAPLPAMQEK